MAETLHLQKRGDVWHYYRRTPRHLVPIIKKHFFKRSLKTSSLAEARKLRTVEDLKVDALFSAAEQHTLTNGNTGKTVSLGVLIEYVRQTVERLDRRSAESLITDPPQDRDELQDLWKEADYERCILTNPADPRRDEWVSWMSDRVLTEAGGRINDMEINAKFAEVVRRGLLELTRRKSDRLQDQHDRPFYDALFDPSRPSSVTFGELAELYVAEVEQEHHHNAISQKRTDKIKAIVATLQEIVTDQTAVHTIDDDLVQHIRSVLARTPSNRHKIYPNVPLDKAIELATKQKKRTLAPVTQGVYLDTLRDLLKVAVRKKFLLTNPAAAVKPLKRDTVSADKKRLPLTPEQLRDFFEGQFYKSCAPDAEHPYSKPDRSWRYWLPLLMLFSGARPNELAQLHIADVKQTAKFTWYFDLEDEDDKTLKTETSRRRVPLHPELVRLGFLEFVEERKKQAGKNGPRLFHELAPNKYGNHAWYAAKRFNEVFLPAEIVLGPRQSLYSLRHNVRDALRRLKAPDETLLAVCGWAPNGKAVSTDYGDYGHPDLHAEWVERIAYDGLDLSFLYRT